MLFVDYPLDQMGAVYPGAHRVSLSNQNHSPMSWSHFRHPDSESPWKHAIHIGMILVSVSLFIVILFIGISNHCTIRRYGFIYWNVS